MCNLLCHRTCWTFLCFVFISTLIEPSKGGLLSSQLSPKSYYVVKYFDNKIKVEDGQKYDKGLTSLQSTPYSDCGSTSHITTLQVNSCKSSSLDSSICEIKRGSNVTFALGFIPRSNATQLKAVIHGIVDFVPIPLPCPQPDACHKSGIQCPIQAGKPYNYKLQALIKESYPRMKLWVKGQLEDEDGENVICVKIHVHIV